MRTVVEALANLQRTSESPLLRKLGELFVNAGFELSLVGGPVRDAFLGRETADLDFTTSATPDQILEVLKGNVDAHWDIGREYGTIGARIGDDMVEITTYRAESYDAESRKPVVAPHIPLPFECADIRRWARVRLFLIHRVAPAVALTTGL